MFLLISILLGLSAQASLLTDAQGSSSCPVITVTCPESVDQSETMVCSASVSGASDLKNIKFRWTVSRGKILQGQDAESVEVETKGLFPESVLATVEVVAPWWPFSCPRQATGETVLFISDPGPKLYLQYGDISFEEEKERLHSLALLLEEDKGTQPYIIVYAGRRAYPKEAAERGKRAKQFLLENYGIEDARVVVVDGGHRETQCTELWLVPQGASDPVTTPTIDPKAVEVLKGKKPKTKN